MIIVHPTSLAATLDSAAEAIFYSFDFPLYQQEEFACMIVNRQPHTGPNAGFFIPFAAETEASFRLFSGEKLNTTFARTQALLIESARVLRLLDIKHDGVTATIQSASSRMAAMCYCNFCSKGECKALTISYLRYLATQQGEPGVDSRITELLTRLTVHRDRKGKWGAFPFFYTLLMLTEINAPQATHELQYAAQSCIKQPAGPRQTDIIAKRHQAILARALARS